MRKHINRLLAIVAAISFSLSVAHAATWTAYTNQSAFNAALSAGSYTTNFTYSPDGPLDSPLPISGNGLSASAIPTDGTYTLYGFANGLSVSSEGEYALHFTNFSANTVAFGGKFFNLSTDGTFSGGSLTLDVTFADLGTVTTNITAASLENFWGIAANTNIISFSLTSVAGLPTAGQVTLGAVPEPSTVSLIAMSVSAAVLGSRLRGFRRR